MDGGYGHGGYGYEYEHRTARTATATTWNAARLIAIALAHALALFAAVAASINISGGHVNPAVTFATLVGGRISLIRAVYYWVGQLLGAIVASLLLRLVTGGMVELLSYCVIYEYFHIIHQKRNIRKFSSAMQHPRLG